MALGEFRKAHNGIHGRADVVGDVEQERRLNFVATLLLFQFEFHAEFLGHFPLQALNLSGNVAVAHDDTGVTGLAVDADDGHLHIDGSAVAARTAVIDCVGALGLEAFPDSRFGDFREVARAVVGEYVTLSVERENVATVRLFLAHFRQQILQNATAVAVTADVPGVEVEKQDRGEVDAQSLDDLRFPDSFITGGAEIRNVAGHDVVYIPVLLRMHEAPVVVNPAHRAVLARYPVLHIIKVPLVPQYLFGDRGLYLLQVVRVNHAREGAPGQLPELLPSLTAEHVQQNLVGVQDFFFLVGPVDEKASRHLLHVRQRAADCFLCHCTTSFLSRGVRRARTRLL